MTPRKRPGRPPKILPTIDPEETIHQNVTFFGREWNAIRAHCIANHLIPSQVLRIMVNHYISTHPTPDVGQAEPAQRPAIEIMLAESK